VASFAGQPPQIRAAGGAGVTWAEDGAGPWEAFISGHPAKKNRSMSIADEVVGRLGGSIQWPRMADGGLMHFSRQYTPSTAPVVVQAPSAPRAAPINYTALARAMAKEMSPAFYDATFRGTAQQRRDEYARAATTPRGRSRG